MFYDHGFHMGGMHTFWWVVLIVCCCWPCAPCPSGAANVNANAA